MLTAKCFSKSHWGTCIPFSLLVSFFLKGGCGDVGDLLRYGVIWRWSSFPLLQPFPAVLDTGSSVRGEKK